MIGRAIGTSIAMGITLSAVSGIALLIALDIAGEDLVFGAFSFLKEEPPEPTVAAVVEELPALAGAKDITFFKSMPVAGLPFEVTTGVRFASPADLVGNLVESRWCYVTAMAADGIGRKINLADQTGNAAPLYHALEGLPSQQLALFKLGATALEALAKTHCAFNFTTPAAGGAE